MSTRLQFENLHTENAENLILDASAEIILF